jgi:molecular chaperone DnaK
MYADVQKAAAAQGASAGEAPQPAAAKSDAAGDDNVVDAEFKEVKT